MQHKEILTVLLFILIKKTVEIKLLKSLSLIAYSVFKSRYDHALHF